MWMAAGNLVLLTDCRHFGNGGSNCRVVVLTGMTQVFDRSPSPMSTTPIPGTCSSIFGKLVIARFSSHMITTRISPSAASGQTSARCNILPRDAPVPRGSHRSVTTLTSWTIIRCLFRAGIAASSDRVQRVLHRADMWPNYAVDAEVQYLLSHPLAVLSTIGRDAHERRNRRG